MARKISAIRQFLIDTLVSKAAAIGISIDPTKWSKYDYKLLILDTIATGMGILEQLWDVFKSDVQKIVDVAAPETPAWFQNQLLNKYQFNAATPQVPQILPPNFEPSFPNPNVDYNIIKYCSVTPGLWGTTRIKVAAQVGGFPADIDTVYGAGTLDTIKSFVNTISDPSIIKNVTSGIADKMWMQLDVYYNGLFAGVIQANVIAAINSYFASLTPNGTLQGTIVLTDLIKAIKAVEGVNDVVPINLRGRDDGTAFGGGVNMVISKTIINRLYNTYAGYVIPEVAPNSFTDPRPLEPTINNLNLIAQ